MPVPMRRIEECPAACAEGIDMVGEPCRACGAGLAEAERRAAVLRRELDAARADAAGWKKGVEDANRLTQEHQARADRLERELAEARKLAAEGRQAGRAEAAQMLMDRIEAECFDPENRDTRGLVEGYAIGDTGDYGASWVPQRVRKAFDVPEDGGVLASLLERMEGGYWEAVARLDSAVMQLGGLAHEHEALRRDLDTARAREVVLREMLGAARRFMAAQLLRERAEQDRPGNMEGLRFDEQDALQRLRDTLRETRPALLGATASTGGHDRNEEGK